MSRARGVATAVALLALVTAAGAADAPVPLAVGAANLSKRVTFLVDRGGRIRYVDAGGLAIETDRTLDALTKLARAK